MSILALWLSGDFGFDDRTAGDWFGIFSALLSLFGFLVGVVTEIAGTQRTLVLSFAAAMLTRAMMAFSSSSVVTLVALLAYSLAIASATPVLQAAVHKYSTKRTVTIAYSLAYVATDIGGVLAGQVIDRTKAFFVDATTQTLSLRTWTVPILGPVPMSAYRAIVAVGGVTAALAFLVTLFLRADRDVPTHAKKPAHGGAGPRKGPVALLRTVVADKAFWRFMLLIALLAIVRCMFVHMRSTWPKYITRERGEAFDWGSLWALNSLLGLVLVPGAALLTRRLPAFPVILAGAFVTAASPFVFALGPSTEVQIAAVVLFTVGEALWSPRSYEYTVTIAPQGQEVTYASLATLPYFLAKFFVSRMSGSLLATYCPAVGERHPTLMWSIIGLSTMLGPLGLLAFRGRIAPHARTPRDGGSASSY